MFTGLDDLVIIARCVGGHGLAAVCRLLAEDFSGWAGVWHQFGCFADAALQVIACLRADVLFLPRVAQ